MQRHIYIYRYIVPVVRVRLLAPACQLYFRVRVVPRSIIWQHGIPPPCYSLVPRPFFTGEGKTALFMHAHRFPSNIRIRGTLARVYDARIQSSKRDIHVQVHYIIMENKKKSVYCHTSQNSPL